MPFYRDRPHNTKRRNSAPNLFLSFQNTHHVQKTFHYKINATIAKKVLHTTIITTTRTTLLPYVPPHELPYYHTYHHTNYPTTIRTTTRTTTKQAPPHKKMLPHKHHPRKHHYTNHHPTNPTNITTTNSMGRLSISTMSLDVMRVKPSTMQMCSFTNNKRPSLVSKPWILAHRNM